MVISSSDSVAKLRRHILLPIYWNYIRRLKTLNYYEKLRKIQWNSMQENQKIQRKKLYELIKYASQNIPYYRKIIKKYYIQFSEDTIFDDIKKFPVLNKEIIRNHFHELYKFKDNTYYRNTSGGSTGKAVVFYQDKNYLEWANATKRLYNEWAGRRIGDPMIKLWGSLRDILQGGRSIKGICGSRFPEQLF